MSPTIDHLPTINANHTGITSHRLRRFRTNCRIRWRASFGFNRSLSVISPPP